MHDRPRSTQIFPPRHVGRVDAVRVQSDDTCVRECVCYEMQATLQIRRLPIRMTQAQRKVQHKVFQQDIK
jgi:hypothetical protein